MSFTHDLPNAVDDQYARADEVRGSSEDERLELLFYADGTVRFAHVCSRVDRGVIRCAPRLAPGHQVIDRGPGHVTVVPSILCDDCGTHGFITDGTWRAA